MSLKSCKPNPRLKQKSLVPVEMTGGQAIRIALASRGVTFAAIARELETTRKAVSGCANGHWRSPRVEAAIAAHLGVAPETLFGPRSLPAESVTPGAASVNARVSGSDRHGRTTERQRAA